ncbi:hypothetical protein B0H13DRAFT_2317184 [Mycena leptocephala]|nr:hypothetical protein B0H13DRAFT_2317184 [Mycena leptocephala]
MSFLCAEAERGCLALDGKLEAYSNTLAYRIPQGARHPADFERGELDDDLDPRVLVFYRSVDSETASARLLTLTHAKPMPQLHTAVPVQKWDPVLVTALVIKRGCRIHVVASRAGRPSCVCVSRRREGGMDMDLRPCRWEIIATRVLVILACERDPMPFLMRRWSPFYLAIAVSEAETKALPSLHSRSPGSCPRPSQLLLVDTPLVSSSTLTSYLDLSPLRLRGEYAPASAQRRYMLLMLSAAR